MLGFLVLFFCLFVFYPPALRKNFPTYLEGEKNVDWSHVQHLTLSSIQHLTCAWYKSPLISSTSTDSSIGRLLMTFKYAKIILTFLLNF